MKRVWVSLPGQPSGITWSYFLMLAGTPGVQADRMIIGYTNRVLGLTVTAKEAGSLVGVVADQLGVVAATARPCHLAVGVWSAGVPRP